MYFGVRVRGRIYRTDLPKEGSVVQARFMLSIPGGGWIANFILGDTISSILGKIFDSGTYVSLVNDHDFV